MPIPKKLPAKTERRRMMRGLKEQHHIDEWLEECAPGRVLEDLTFDELTRACQETHIGALIDFLQHSPRAGAYLNADGRVIIELEFVTLLRAYIELGGREDADDPEPISSFGIAPELTFSVSIEVGLTEAYIWKVNPRLDKAEIRAAAIELHKIIALIPSELNDFRLTIWRSAVGMRAHDDLQEADESVWIAGEFEEHVDYDSDKTYWRWVRVADKILGTHIARDLGEDGEPELAPVG